MRVLAISHVAYEHLGSLETELRRVGANIESVDACVANLAAIDPISPDLIIVLGGPVGVYQTDAYPFVADEIHLLTARIDAKRPTLGICLGAQLIAAAMGAKVYPGAQGIEIGWALVLPTADIWRYPGFATLINGTERFLHWHGDTFDAPRGAIRLAETEKYPNQAFALEDFGLALQFHPEVTANMLEQWYVGHAAELAQHQIDVRALRAESRIFAPKLEESARRFWRDWINAGFRLTAAP